MGVRLGDYSPLLELLLLELLLDVGTERHQTLGFLAVFGMIAAERNQLLTDRAAAMSLFLALARMLHHTLHLLTGRQSTIGVLALACMHQ